MDERRSWHERFRGSPYVPLADAEGIGGTRRSGGNMDRSTITQALAERRVLQIIYGGGGPRTVQPHAILRKPDGTELLEAYQVHGFSEGGMEHGWKHFDMARIDHAEPREETFEPRRDFRPVSSESGVVVAQVRSDAALNL